MNLVMEYPLALCLWALLGLGLLQLQGHGSLGCLEEQRGGLLELKDAFGHQNLNGSPLSSWGGEDSDCCRWEGVRCDNTTKQVIQLSLNREIPEYWYGERCLEEYETAWLLNASLLLPFPELQILNMASNCMSGLCGVFPLKKLQVLDLSFNLLTELSSLGELINLKYLDLSWNLLYYSNHFQELTIMKNLEVLNLSYNQIAGEIPSSIWTLTSLSVLSLRGNELNGTTEGFQGILNLKKLQYLALGANFFTELPPLVGALINLKYLDFSSNMLKNLNHFQGLTNLSNLEMLILGSLNPSDNYTIGEIFPFIWNLTSLTVLSIRWNKQNGTLPAGLCKLKNLQELDLGGNSFEGNLPSCLSNLTSLRALDLFENNFVGTIPSTLFPSLYSLEYVSLSDNYFQGLFSFSSFVNSSKLKVFDLTTCNNHFKVETENTPWSPPFQLEFFRLSNCVLNEPSGAIPSFLLKQYNLRVIDLSNNKMKGKVPTWLFENNTRLTILNLTNNSLFGHLDMHLNSENLNMTSFDVSMNHIQGEVPSYIATIFPNLIFLNMSGNELQGSIPPSVGNMTMLRTLDLSSNNFSGLLPMNFLMGCISLIYLKLSNNSLQGQFLSTKSNLTSLRYIYLDNNHFSGEISPALLHSSKLISLDLSNNKISGRIPHWIGNFPELSSLILSRNSLEGPIPMGFCKLDELKFLDLSWNNFIDLMPSCLNLSRLRYLHLERNGFRGPIPNVISRSLSLVTLDMRNNNLSRGIPSWMSLLSNLRILLLKGNNLDGTIPFELCQLDKISIIDLSHNNFFGPIPSCLKNIPFGMKGALDNTFSTGDYSYETSQPLFPFYYGSQNHIFQRLISYLKLHEKEEVEFISKSRLESYGGSILYFMSGMDLSSNKLIGPIPPEIGDLSGIHTLNLSHNHLDGSIPKTFSGLKNIESLDLSHNRLSGQIPPQLIELPFLSVFKVAYNNLSGKTLEIKAQFATFDQSSYEGNPLLCGPPLERNCTITGVLPSVLPPSSDHEENDLFKVIFLWSFGAAFVVAFLGSLSFLYFNTYFQSLLSSFIYEYVLSYR